MKDISITTFNCGKHFPYDERVQLQSVLDCLIPPSSDPLDLYVIGFQELVEIWEGSFTQIVNNGLLKIADGVVSLLQLRFPDEHFQVIATSNLGAIGMVIVGKQYLQIRDIQKGNCSRGMFYSNLKGGTAIHMNLLEDDRWENFVFMNCHLAANEGEWNRELRVQDQDAIIKSCFNQFQLASMSRSHVFFLGDLNFRNFKQYDAYSTDYSNTYTRQEILQEIDELNILRHRGTIFEGFEEPPITFLPTFKYILDGTNKYNPKRVPSWCDRVLYSTYNSKIKTKYTSMRREQPLLFSDHQPVNLTATLPELYYPRHAITISSISTNHVTDLVDTVIGYTGWMVSLRVHWCILALLILFIIYKKLI
ncbi:similar to Saccharomyces cerevisiae YOL065C INP54 Phosphatidylinositol 4,5-bisphosphate 5- phosphatase with a role in secretion, localizes to the endoplasmic reticulum via the C-terminal tail [Maudiozyma barnettii]|uniref:Similar to Saccharomyces cerevisiae YOL065C INP54 Phosphatidylinositol 4,5-bisphosphate 5- phosphatase with a role in secretion, localizes to the endoplasmic reticulum via the C-terminal tail n=1 Tax=Maudiozyma barnettii TaxID=61262 RepID=A0A8H2VKW3_9SACH|nr:phosphoinositide 5-phosphatase INP54 [Kazachstania barnettii]CAB4257204.1 similar to Saccharomyces cerevisiae YOL065C INP54 Phosphatidylinositol 4,5-bisphosphate 5- phosphatase with a role in secretion, localizes to the endoplasmic reticulum via the C-terminal tail [Kazachstania barnettii]CAD1779574.1 similar to Saccharomyces cerevisiae YOL065C INP54 Phosphatidylinositol 4,5-bisphosphate 5- phosphatase with a role in secretion, localizes to the endoplasmic reticulum via the C-terminal tail [Ka